MSPQVKLWASIGERLTKSFVVAFVGVYVAGGLSISRFADASVLEKAADAGLAALGSLILSLVGTNVGNTNTPSLLPKPLDPTTRAAPQIIVPNGADDAADLHAGLSRVGPPDGWPTPDVPEAESGQVAVSAEIGELLEPWPAPNNEVQPDPKG